MDLINRFKDSTAKLISKIPEPVKHLIKLKNDKERQTYLETLPPKKVQAMFKWFTYVLLAGDLLGKATKAGIKVPTDVKEFLEMVEIEVKKAGKLSVKSVDIAIDKVQQTLKVAIAIPIILFGAFLILNPATALAIFTAIVAFEASTLIFASSSSGWFSSKDKDETDRDSSK